MKVVTVTLNPSLERTLVVHYLASGYHNQTTETSRLDAAGRGINISRALSALRTETHAVALLGNDATGIAYRALLDAESFNTSLLHVTGRTRSRIVIWDSGNKLETIVGEDNSGFSMEEVRQVAKRLEELLEPGDLVVYAGPLPAGISDNAYVELLHLAKEKGAEVVLDLPNSALQATIAEKPSLVFMNQSQTEAYFNFPVRQQEEVIYCAQKLCEAGAEQALIMLTGDAGALLATAEGDILLIEFPERESEGTHSGTISAMLAGYLAARLRHQPLATAMELGAAAALYTTQHIGNQFAESVELPEHLKQVKAQSLRIDTQLEGE